MSEELNERQRARETRRLSRRYANRPRSLEILVDDQTEDGTTLTLNLYDSDGTKNYSMGNYLGTATFVTGGEDPYALETLDEEPEKLDLEGEE